MRKHAVVFVDVERDQSTDGGDAVQRVEEEPVMFEGAPPRFDHGVRELQFGEGQDPAQHARGDQVVDLGIHVLDALGVITLVAATINGALGYGFSSITVPLALLFLSNRVLNPALVLIEVPLNAYVLRVNRDTLPSVWRRVVPMVGGLVP